MPRTKIKKHMSVETLLHLGEVSLNAGDAKAAHLYWQRAALLEPDREEVWLALLKILEKPDDRRVCLRNILAINPDNARAQRQLDELLHDTEPVTEMPPPTTGASSRPRSPLPHYIDTSARRDRQRDLVLVIVALMLGFLLFVFFFDQIASLF
jgi:hypothetical protein